MPRQLIEKSDVLLTILATFSFTMLGFLITALAVIVGMSDKPRIISYAKFGFFRVFGELYLITLVTLLATFVLSSIAVVMTCLLPLVVKVVMVSIAQILMISISSYSLIFRKKGN
ncbi:hypothetical protein [Vibrio jasicida]|uniref:hypothetical protein n=1 Tax=Vibrio jasicida TaxID=766224 RepID=UPI0005F09816|nr:hypothetical protein [Vibrio jasicida]